MEQRVSLVTLGVADLGRARAFYEALGWRSDSKPEDGVVFFQCPGMILGLWSRSELAEDGGLEDGGGWGGVTLAYNARSREEVDAVLGAVAAAGARVSKPARATFWGGYSGTFVDPEGHAWEVAHNPFWTIGPDGAVSL
jgi:predicted lactoylglutathione lyase